MLLIRKGFSWLFYACFIEKKWQIASCKKFSNLSSNISLDLGESDKIPRLACVSIMADPVGIYHDKLYAEFVNRFSGIGKIGYLEKGSSSVSYLKLPRLLHYSFPQILSENGRNYLFPESSKHSSPMLYELDDKGEIVNEKLFLRGFSGYRLIDAILFHLDHVWYLFASISPEKSGELRLWKSTTLFGEFQEHENSPIAKDVRTGRMAGPIYFENGNLYRFAQNSEENYGGSVVILQISQISESNYKEREIGSIRVDKAIGPHSIIFDEDEIYFDYYHEKLSLGAGVRRLLPILFHFVYKLGIFRSRHYSFRV